MAKSSSSASKGNRKMKLEKMPTEELKKWAIAYGFNAESERDVLLAELVNNFAFQCLLCAAETYNYLLHFFFSYLIPRTHWQMASWTLIDPPIFLWICLNSL